MTFPEHIRKIQARLDDVLEAYRAKSWPKVWALFRAMVGDVEAAKQAAFNEERG